VKKGPAPIKIGIIYSYTGVAQSIGLQFDAAIKAYMDQHGDTIAGRKIELIKRDDQTQRKHTPYGPSAG
jgi:branched-chain amino acid transport system substrate-binding protein